MHIFLLKKTVLIKIDIVKFRIYSGKIFLLPEYAYFIWRRLQQLNFFLEIEEIEKKLLDLEGKVKNEKKDFLAEVFFRTDIVSAGKTSGIEIILVDLWPINEKQQDLGVALKFEKNPEKMATAEFWNLFWVQKGKLHYFRARLNDPLAVYGVRLLTEIMPEQELEVDCQLFSEEFLKNLEEMFYVNSVEGVVSVRRVGKFDLGNSRFFARKLRKLFYSKIGY